MLRLYTYVIGDITGACFGGPLSAAVFCDALTEPLAFISDDGAVVELRENSIEKDL